MKSPMKLIAVLCKVPKIINSFNEFGAKVFHCLVERRVKTEDPFSTFAIEVKPIISSEIFKIFIRLFINKQGNFKNFSFFR